MSTLDAAAFYAGLASGATLKRSAGEPLSPFEEMALRALTDKSFREAWDPHFNAPIAWLAWSQRTAGMGSEVVVLAGDFEYMEGSDPRIAIGQLEGGSVLGCVHIPLEDAEILAEQLLKAAKSAREKLAADEDDSDETAAVSAVEDILKGVAA